MKARSEPPYFDAELARLSEIVYGGDDTPPLPPFWETFYAYEDTTLDFKAVCYFKNAGSDGLPLSVAIVFRGTLFTSIENVIGDIQLALGYLPNQVQAIETFGANLADECIAKLGLDNKEKAEKFSLASFVTTGHSLGAALAEIAALRSGFTAKAVTFENPGIEPILERIFGKIPPDVKRLIYENCRTVLSDVDIVNTCNPQVGQIFRMVGLPYDYGKINKLLLRFISPYYRLNLNYFYYSLLDQHSITKISSYLYRNDSLEESKGHPSNLASGYRQYLSDNRSVYWRGYAETIWEHFPEIHDKYKDFSEYYEEFILYLRDAHSKAPAISPALNDLETHSHQSLNIEIPISKHKTFFDFLCSLSESRDELQQLEEQKVSQLITIAETDISNGMYSEEITGHLVLRLCKAPKRPDTHEKIYAIANIKTEDQINVSSIHLRRANPARYQCEFFKYPQSMVLRLIKKNPVELDVTNNATEQNDRSKEELTKLSVKPKY
jgi:hypothetical protein